MTHADLERYHYEALKDPRYLAWLLHDEAMMAIEPALAPSLEEEIISPDILQFKERIDILEGRIAYVQNLLTQKRPPYSKVFKYE